jgi:hypothetical protein
VRRRQSVVAAGLAAVTVAALAGCTGSGSRDQAAVSSPTSGSGGSSAGGHASKAAPAAPALVLHPREAVRLAASKARHAGSAHFTGRVFVKLSAAALGASASNLSSSAVIDITGDEQWSPSLRARMVMSGIPGIGGGTSTTMLLIGRTMYMHLPELTEQPRVRWVRLDLGALAQQAGVGLDSLFSGSSSLDPSDDLRQLLASGDLRRIGTAKVAGVPTTHVRGTIPVGHSLAGSLGAAAEKYGLRDARVDVWIDAQSRVRQETMTMRGRGLRMRVDMTMSRYGEAVVVTPPPKSAVTDLSALSGSLGS